MLFFCLLQEPVGHAAKINPVLRKLKRAALLAVGAKNQSRKRIEDLAGEWQVKCEITTYDKGEVKTIKENDESLVVAETDPDGSYMLYKFPIGFGEGLPRLRKISATRYEGDDTVHGTATVVKQSVELERGKIIIKQIIIDAASKQPQSETLCTGERLPSASKFFAAARAAEVCSTDQPPADSSVERFARQYKSVKPFSDGLAAVAIVPQGARTEKWGFIDATGRVVIPMRYDVATSFKDGLAAVGKYYGRGQNLKWGIVEKLGPQVTPHVHYDAVKILGEGFAAVGYAVPGRSGLKWNLINRENTTVFYGFDEIGCFKDGRARASYTDEKGVHTGYVNKVGDFFADNR